MHVIGFADIDGFTVSVCLFQQFTEKRVHILARPANLRRPGAKIMQIAVSQQIMQKKRIRIGILHYLASNLCGQFIL